MYEGSKKRQQNRVDGDLSVHIILYTLPIRRPCTRWGIREIQFGVDHAANFLIPPSNVRTEYSQLRGLLG